MSLENQLRVDELKGSIFGNEKYELKKSNLGNSNSNSKTKDFGIASNTQPNINNNINVNNNNNNSTSSSRMNLIETIENISEGMVTYNNYSSHSSSNSNSNNYNINTHSNNNNNKNININYNSYTNKNNNISINNSGSHNKKNKNLINRKKNHINTNKSNTTQFYPYEGVAEEENEEEEDDDDDNEEDIISNNTLEKMNNMNETNNNVSKNNANSNKNTKHAKNEKKEKKQNIKHSAYTHISQIYDTDDADLKEEEEDKDGGEEEEKQEENTKKTKEFSAYEENSFVALFYAVIFIIVGTIISLHTYLDENHILIKGLSNISNYILKFLKSVSVGRSLMHAVSATNAGIDKILSEMVKKYEGTEAYVDALKKVNTEFCILSLFTILALFICGMFVNIVCNIIHVKQKKGNIRNRKNNSEERKKNKCQPKPVLVMNRMTVEEFDDRTFTYNEIKKLHEDEDYICLKNKRAGDGVDAWNWQSRLANATEQKSAFLQNENDICSDIDLSGLSSSAPSALSAGEEKQYDEKKKK